MNENTKKSLTLIFSQVDLMITPIVLGIPVTFGQAGLVFSCIVLLIMAFTQYHSSKPFVANLKKDQKSFLQILTTQFEEDFMKIFFEIPRVAIIILLLIYTITQVNNTFWQVFIGILKLGSVRDDVAAKDHKFSFKKYSIQYQTLMLMIYLAVILFKKRPSQQSLINNAAFGGLLCLLLPLFYMIQYCENIFSMRIDDEDTTINILPEGSNQVTVVIGQFFFGFMMPLLTSDYILSTNDNQQKNPVYFQYAYFFTFCIYGLSGVFGNLGITGIKAQQDDPSLIYHYLSEDDPIRFCINVVFFIKLITSLPILIHVSKRNLYNLMYQFDVFHQDWLDNNDGEDQISDDQRIYEYIFNGVLIFLTFFFCFLLLSAKDFVNFVISFLIFPVFFAIPCFLYICQQTEIYYNQHRMNRFLEIQKEQEKENKEKLEKFRISNKIQPIQAETETYAIAPTNKPNIGTEVQIPAQKPQKQQKDQIMPFDSKIKQDQLENQPIENQNNNNTENNKIENNKLEVRVQPAQAINNENNLMEIEDDLKINDDQWDGGRQDSSSLLDKMETIFRNKGDISNHPSKDRLIDLPTQYKYRQLQFDDYIGQVFCNVCFLLWGICMVIICLCYVFMD